MEPLTISVSGIPRRLFRRASLARCTPPQCLVLDDELLARIAEGIKAGGEAKKSRVLDGLDTSTPSPATQLELPAVGDISISSRRKKI